MNTRDRRADTILAKLCSDLLLLARMLKDGTPEGGMREVVVHELRELADTMAVGGTPDPFPYLAHGRSSGRSPEWDPEIHTTGALRMPPRDADAGDVRWEMAHSAAHERAAVQAQVLSGAHEQGDGILTALQAYMTAYTWAARVDDAWAAAPRDRHR